MNAIKKISTRIDQFNKTRRTTNATDCAICHYIRRHETPQTISLLLIKMACEECRLLANPSLISRHVQEQHNPV